MSYNRGVRMGKRSDHGNPDVVTAEHAYEFIETENGTKVLKREYYGT